MKKYSTKAAQTLFRTLSRNNYALDEMIDRKANIMITTNAIIISVILGTSLCKPVLNNISPLIIISLLSIWIISIICALYAIKPFIIYPKDIKLEQNQLLNFHSINSSDIQDYKKRFNEVLQNEHCIYNTMIEDIYHIGRNIKQKHLYLSIAAYFLLLGIILAVIFYLMPFLGN